MDHLTETTLPPDPQGPAPIIPSLDLTDKTLGDFHVLRRLGEGGMGQVYLAEQVSLKRKVALKLLKADLAANPTALQRFKAEAEAVARATHANIVQVYTIAEENGLHYMALEYVEGRNLRDYLAKKGPPQAQLALSIMRQCAAALQRASELGIVHRDIKPDNILLTRKGEVKIADFGLSRDLSGEGQPLNLTGSGVTMGTPLYMSPEQVKGLKVDARTDIYSLGVTCYHMLAGEPPFRGATAFDVALQHVQATPRPLQGVRPDLPADLCAIVHKMMAKNPDERYPTGRDLLRDLNRVRAGIPGAGSVTASQLFADVGEAGKTLVEARSVSAGRRVPVLPLAVIASLALAVLAGVGLGWYYRHPAPPPPASNDPLPPDTVLTPQKREQSLKEVVAQYANPGKDPAKLATGYTLNMDLGLFYLEQKRWDDADRFFTELIDNPNKVDSYSFLGRIGHAIVSGMQSKKAKESIDQFEKLLPDKPEGPGSKPSTRDAGLRNHKLRQWIGEALEYDFKNEPAYYAKSQTKLDAWRKPPGAAAK
jgi:serine/threonine protein kinase